MRVYERLGTDKPHKSRTTKRLETDDDPVRWPLTPTESNEDKSGPSTVTVRKPSQDRAHTRPQRKMKDTSNAAEETLTPEPPTLVSQKSSKSWFPKKGWRKTAADDKPYEDLFEASLILNEGPTVWEITDLRTNIKGGERIWKERAKCLVCNNILE